MKPPADITASRMQQRLLAGQPVAGLFHPRGADFVTPGILSWSPEAGAEVDLVERTHPWPTDFDQPMTVFGQPYDGEPLTLFDAHVGTLQMGGTSLVRARVLALNQHVRPDERWPVAKFCPAHLHAWYPKTGIAHHYEGDDERRLLISYEPPDELTAHVGGAAIRLTASARFDWVYSPDWSIRTAATFSVTADEPLTVEDYADRFGYPLLAFMGFAADATEHLVRESYFNPQSKLGIVVMRAGVEADLPAWRPRDERFLFRAEHLDDLPQALAKWFVVWRATAPALALFYDAIAEGSRYSAPRFLTLFSAAESYYKSIDGSAPWKIDRIAERADVAEHLTGATADALRLIGVSRNYHAHLDASGPFTPQQIVNLTSNRPDGSMR